MADGMSFEEFSQRLLSNYAKIKDMRATVFSYTKDTERKKDPDKFILEAESLYLYKAPNKFKFVPYKKATLAMVILGNKRLDRDSDTGELLEEEIIDSQFTLYPDDPMFYGRMIEYMKQKENVVCRGMGDNGEIIFDAMPQDMDKDIEGRLYFDPKRNVLTKFEMFGRRTFGDHPTAVMEWQDFKEVVPGGFIPTKLSRVQYQFRMNKRKLYEHTGEKMTEEMVFKDIVVNKGINDKEFEI